MALWQVVQIMVEVPIQCHRCDAMMKLNHHNKPAVEIGVWDECEKRHPSHRLMS